jgi:hypothetical protein
MVPPGRAALFSAVEVFDGHMLR